MYEHLTSKVIAKYIIALLHLFQLCPINSYIQLIEQYNLYLDNDL